jgi:hypothetical protein
MAGKQPPERVCSLVADDLDTGEALAEPGRGKLCFLVQQVAFGDQNEACAVGEGIERRLDTGQEFNRMLQQIAADGEDVAYGRWRQRVAGKLGRRLQHGEREALHAIAVERKVTRAHGLEPFKRGRRGGERFEYREQGLLGSIEVAHVVPQRVIGIEADKFDRHAVL